MEVLGVIDHELEAEHGDLYPLHPQRAKHGDTVNPSASGLFEIGAAFSAGYGSERGRGYIVDVRMATLSAVSVPDRERLQQYVAERLRVLLPVYFPGQDLRIERDGKVFKIIGDLKL